MSDEHQSNDPIENPLGLVRNQIRMATRGGITETTRASRALLALAVLGLPETREAQGQDASETEAYREAYNRGFANAEHRFKDWDALYMADQELEKVRGQLQSVRDIVAALEPDQPDHEVRWLRAYLAGQVFPALTPEEPEPGRDWSRVRGHLFNAHGKWKYQVWLDYTELRHRGVSGEGPSGWHYNGPAMAKLALERATDSGTSDVSIKRLPIGWRLFVQDPPQGFPCYAVGGEDDE